MIFFDTLSGSHTTAGVHRSSRLARVACFIFMICLMTVGSSSAQETYTAIDSWGAGGTGEGEFSYPAGLDIDPAGGSIYVADTLNSRIQQFDLYGAFIRMWGKDGGAAGESGAGDGEFNYPSAVSVSPGDGIYVTDDENFRVQKFDFAGGFITKWGPQLDASGILAPILQPAGIKASPAGVYIADIWQSRIQLFDIGGAYVSYWDHPPGIGESDLFRPTGLAVDSSGNVYMTDYWNNQVTKFSPAGIFIASWGGYGTGDGQFDYPSAIAVDAADNVYVADTLNNRIQKFDSDGNFIVKWGVEGIAPGEFDRPFGVVVAPDGTVYVADTFNHRIQAFSPVTLIELERFSARPGSRSVTLSWSTASETDNAGFNIYRAAEGEGGYVKLIFDSRFQKAMIFRCTTPPKEVVGTTF